MEVIFAPPTAFLIYLVFAMSIARFGRALAGPEKPTPRKVSQIAGGEPALGEMVAPGYRPFFLIALFFALLHLGVLLLATADSSVALIYMIGLICSLMVFILEFRRREHDT
jgi:NADH:ubiquinone oxidoreductase subunit 3 (subunit A)